MKHERTHTGVKSFARDTCETSFGMSGTLMAHEKTHTAVDPYTCDTWEIVRQISYTLNCMKEHTQCEIFHL